MACWHQRTATSSQARDDGKSAADPVAARRRSEAASRIARRPGAALVKGAWALMALLTVAAAAASAETLLKIATVSPPRSPWMQIVQRAADEVEAATNGRVAFKFYAGGSRGDDATAMRRIRVGNLQGGVVTAAAFARQAPDVQLYNMPMVFRSLAEVDAVRETMDPVLIDILAESEFLAFGLAEVGMAYVMTNKANARTVADGRRLKVWTPQGDVAAARIFDAFGIAPVPLTIADVLGGLQTGLIDTLAAPPVAVLPLLWHTRLNYIIDLPFTYIYGVFAVSERSLRNVSGEDRATMLRIMSAATREAEQRNRQDYNRAWQALQDQGLALVRLSDEEIAEWQSRAELANRDWVRKGIISEAVYEALTARLEEIRGAPAR